MFNKKIVSLMLTSMLVVSTVGCSLVPKEENTATPSPLPTLEAESTPMATPVESEVISSVSSPTLYSFKYNATEFLYRLTAYIGADNQNGEEAFEKLKVNSNDFFTETLENGLISTSGIHEIDGKAAYSFIINADKDGNVFEVALTMYPDFLAKTAANGNTLYPYLITYTVCTALQCEATKATSLIVQLMSDENGPTTGSYAFESQNINYHFINTETASVFTLCTGGDGLVFESMK
ncbi:MAG: hypothetical protein IJO48_06210 [Clostridia bacterium]|nr:hypothetical protein [Clostridia bacterium]